MGAQIIRLRQERNFFKSTIITVGSLYYPSDTYFPLVDTFWLENEKTLCAIQATSSESHPKSKGTYVKFFKKLNVDMDSFDFHLYYLILPSKQPIYSKNKVFPPSTFYKNVKKMAKDLDAFGENFKFFAICPPTDFGNGIK